MAEAAATTSAEMEQEVSDSEERRMDPGLYELPPFPKDHPIQNNPLALTPADTNAVYDFIFIDGVQFPAMIISGEPRIPVMMFRRKFHEVSFEDLKGPEAIDYWLMELNIYLHHALPDQYRELKTREPELEQDSLIDFQMITMTDSQRILAKMREQSSQPPMIKKSATLRDAFFRIPIRHNMFGGYEQKGFLYPERKGGRCIQCEECAKFFLPEHFVLHTHSENLENSRTAHWGLSGDNWPLALYLDAETEKIQEMVDAFDKFIFEDEGYAEMEDARFPDAYRVETLKDVASAEPDQKRKKTAEKKSEEFIRLSAEFVAILEGPQDLPPIRHNQLDSYDREYLKIVEDKLHNKATAEAMSGKIFDVAGSSKGVPPREMDIHEQAFQLYRSQQPHVPDPESFPAKAFDHSSSKEVQQQIQSLKLLESYFPDGRPPPEAQQLLDGLRQSMSQSLDLDAYYALQNQLLYSTLLASYKMINVLYRSHTDPSQPLPEGNDFQQLAEKMKALDPLHFMGSPINEQPKAVETVQEVDMTPEKPAEPVNFVELYAKLIKTLGNTSPVKMDVAPMWNPALTGLLTPEAILQSWTKLNGCWNGGLNGLGGGMNKAEPVKMPELAGGINGKMLDLSALMKMPELNGGLKTSPVLNGKLGGSASMPPFLLPGLLPLGHLSPKTVDGLNEDLVARLRSQLFQPLLLGGLQPQ